MASPNNVSQKYICAEGAEALRNLSKAITITMGNFENCVNTLRSTYSSASDGLGEVRDSAEELVKRIEALQKKAMDSSSGIVARINDTARKIDDFLR